MADLSMFDLTGSKAIVTGAGRGIGKAIAIGLAKAGADVVVCARTQADINETTAEIRSLGRKSLPLSADMRNKEDVQSLFKQTLDFLGTLDILVSNAGGTFRSNFMELSDNGWDAIIRENLKTVFLCCKEAAKIMIQNKKGSIVNMASVAAMVPYLSSVPYGVAKAGIVNLTQTLSVLWAPYNIRVNAVAPGIIETEGVMTLEKQRTAEEIETRLRSIAMGRYGKPDEVVGGVIYLASGAASYVTGTTLFIAGGPLSIGMH